MTSSAFESLSANASYEQLSRVRWGRVLIGGVIPHVGWNAVLALFVVLGRDPSVATWLPALSNPGLVAPFGIWGVPVLTIVFTGLVAAIVGRTVEDDIATSHGLLIGLLAAIISLTFGQLWVVFFFTTIAGWLGATIERRVS